MSILSMKIACVLSHYYNLLHIIINPRAHINKLIHENEKRIKHLLCNVDNMFVFYLYFILLKLQVTCVYLAYISSNVKLCLLTCFAANMVLTP